MKKIFCFLTIVLMLTLIFSSCGKGGEEVQLSVDRERLSELSRAFMSDLNSVYLPAMESVDDLRNLDTIVVTIDKTYNYSGLYQFYDGYRMGGDALLDVVFKSTSFVVSRIIFEDGAGYYMRYEYDEFNSDQLSIASQPVGRIEIKEDPDRNTAELLLYGEGKKPITFAFKNIETGETEE